MKGKILKVNRNKSGSGSTSNRIVIPASWVSDMQIEGEIVAFYDDKNKKIILEKRIDNNVR